MGLIFELHIFTEYFSNSPHHFLKIWCKNINQDRSYSQKSKKIMVDSLPHFSVPQYLNCIPIIYLLFWL